MNTSPYTPATTQSSRGSSFYRKPMKRRDGSHLTLGLDLGSSSIGWAVVEQTVKSNRVVKNTILDSGVHLYQSGLVPKSSASLTSQRSGAKAARRTRNRKNIRLRRLGRALNQNGFSPKKGEQEFDEYIALDPIDCRVKAATDVASAHEVGRALLHIAKKRSYKSNRKERRSMPATDAAVKKKAVPVISNDDSDSEEAKQTKKLLANIANTKDVLAANGWTAGQYLANQRSRHRDGSLPKSERGFFDREAILAEFEQIVATQKQDGGALAGFDDDFIGKLRDAIFYQRPLAPGNVGRCSIKPEFRRAPKWLATTELMRLAADINHLRYFDTSGTSRSLTVAERDIVMMAVLFPQPVAVPKDAKKAKQTKKRALFADIRTIIARVQGDVQSTDDIVLLNETDVLDDIAAPLVLPETAALIPGLDVEQVRRDIHGSDVDVATVTARQTIETLMSHLDTLDALSTALQVASDDIEASKNVLSICAEAGWSVSDDVLSSVLDVLPESEYGNISLEVARDILPHLCSPDAVKAFVTARIDAGCPLPDNELADSLPYYGAALPHITSPVPVPVGLTEERKAAWEKTVNSDELLFGRVSNVNAHVGLNQLRKLVNALEGKFGKFSDVNIEFGREFGDSPKRKKKRDKQQKDNRDAKNKLNEQLAAMEQMQSAANRDRLTLFNAMQQKICIYSGTPITKETLFTGAVNVDHIVPRSRGGSDRLWNKVLVTANSNRNKNDRTPFEMWGRTDEWNAIVSRAEAVYGDETKNPAADKRKIALILSSETDESQKDEFMPRQLSDTSALAKWAVMYLSAAYPNVRGISSEVSSKMRDYWGLDEILSDASQPKTFTLGGVEYKSWEKNRNDNRHHAVDAIVLALLPKSVDEVVEMMRRARKYFGVCELPDAFVPPCFSSRKALYDAVENSVKKVRVSVRPNRSNAMTFSNETNYRVLGRARVDGKAMPEPTNWDKSRLREVYDAMTDAEKAHMLAGKPMLFYVFSKGKKSVGKKADTVDSVQSMSLSFGFDRSGDVPVPVRAFELQANAFVGLSYTDCAKHGTQHGAFVQSAIGLARGESPDCCVRIYKDDLIRFSGKTAAEINKASKKSTVIISDRNVYRVKGFSEEAAGRKRIVVSDVNTSGTDSERSLTLSYLEGARVVSPSMTGGYRVRSCGT